MSGEKPAPTAAEIASARDFLDDRYLDNVLSLEFPRTADHIRTLLAALDAAEARATAAETELRERSGADVSIRYRLATAERERDEARAALKPGAIVVSDTEETVERVARAIHAENVAACDGVTEWEDACESVRQFTMCQARAALAALREARP